MSQYQEGEAPKSPEKEPLKPDELTWEELEITRKANNFPLWQEQLKQKLEARGVPEDQMDIMLEKAQETKDYAALEAWDAYWALRKKAEIGDTDNRSKKLRELEQRISSAQTLLKEINRKTAPLEAIQIEIQQLKLQAPNRTELSKMTQNLTTLKGQQKKLGITHSIKRMLGEKSAIKLEEEQKQLLADIKDLESQQSKLSQEMRTFDLTLSDLQKQENMLKIEPDEQDLKQRYLEEIGTLSIQAELLREQIKKDGFATLLEHVNFYLSGPDGNLRIDFGVEPRMTSEFDREKTLEYAVEMLKLAKARGHIPANRNF